jgi:hypothetical protein
MGPFVRLHVDRNVRAGRTRRKSISGWLGKSLGSRTTCAADIFPCGTVATGGLPQEGAFIDARNWATTRRCYADLSGLMSSSSTRSWPCGFTFP